MNASGILLVLEQVGAVMIFIFMLYLIQIWMMSNSEINDGGRALLAKAKSMRSQAYRRSAALLNALPVIREGDGEEGREKQHESTTGKAGLASRLGEALKGNTSDGFFKAI